MSIVRPTATRALVAPLRSTTVSRGPVRSFRNAPSNASRLRRFATEAAPPPPPPPPPASGGSNTTQTLIILGAIAGLGAGGYYLLKPVADVASVTHSTIKSAQQGASGLTDNAAGIAKAFLPPGAFALFSSLSSQSGGINGFLSSLKDGDLQSVLDEVKKHGGDDVKRITEKVEAKLKDAKGKVQDVDWKSLVQELKGELPKEQQHLVDMFIGKIPDKADIDNLINKAKEIGEDQLKQAEKAAANIWTQVEKAKKDGKGQADAFLAGLKQAAPNDIDDLIKQLKEAAKKAGLPADQVESWLKHKAEDNKIDAEALGKQVEDKLRTAAKFLPGDPQDLVKQVEQVSPSLAKLLQQALEQAEVLKNKAEKK